MEKSKASHKYAYYTRKVVVSQWQNIKNKKEPRPIGLGKILLLAMFCFLIAESIACYIFAPALFHRIADPIAEKTVALAKLGKEKAIALASKTQKTIAAWAEQAEQAAQAFKESSSQSQNSPHRQPETPNK